MGGGVSLLNSISYEVLYYERLAQWTLYEALFGLAENRFSHLNIAVQTLQNSFVKTGRLDAEYYQPKYERLIEIIKKYKNGYKKLNDFIDEFSTGFAYKSETYIENKEGALPLIRINNIGRGILDLSNSVYVPNEYAILSMKDIAHENDILISMSGTIGNSCKIPKNTTAVVNQRIMRITSKNIDVDVLPLIINSIIGQFQLERIGTGGVQTNISASDIKEIFIPNLEEDIQQKIALLVQESFTLKQESENLLQQAKQMVEAEIEKGIYSRN